MDVPVDGSRYSMTLRSLVFHFCSEQCLERFTEHPAVYTSSQRIADIRPILKRHRLKFVAAASETLHAACERLLAMKGVLTATPGENCLVVEYNLRLVSLKQIEAMTAKSRLVSKAGLHGLRRDIWKFLECGELESAAHSGTGACCSRPPQRWR